MQKRIQWTLIAVLVLGASVLRLADLSTIEFKGDESYIIHLALPLIEGRELPKVGLMSSVGIHNPPFFVYAVSLPSVLSVDARFVTAALIGVTCIAAVMLTLLLFARRFGWVTAFLAATFYGYGTWPVLYGRKLWAQDLLPIFSVLLLHVLFLLHEQKRTRWVFAVPVLLCVMWQLHFSALILIPVVAVIALWQWRTLNYSALVAGIVSALVLTGPYLSYQMENDYKDIQGLVAMGKGTKADGNKRTKPKEFTFKPVQWTSYIAGGTSVEYSMGSKSSEAYRAWESPSGSLLRTAGGYVGHGLLVLGLVLLFTFKGSNRFVLLAWTLGYIGLFLLIRLERVFPHYFIILYPAQFLLMALPLGWLAQRYERRGQIAAIAVALFVVLAHLSSLSSYRTYLHEKGGVAGDYGVIYKHKADMADWAVGNGLELKAAPGYEYRHLLAMVRQYGDMEQADQAASSRTTPPVGHKRFSVYNTLRQPNRTKLRCKGRQDFGPLVVCTSP